ncbi:MAG: hypothetical protein HY812_03340 [Planctomycetes bacterium]|nr:hypothetical protein [Planctomycetota bacterium]
MPLVFCIAPEPGYAVGWFALSLINAGLAQSKNRSGLGWWLASVFLGPVATFFLVAFCDRLAAAPGKPEQDA